VGLAADSIGTDYHLDGTKKISAIIVSIDKNVKISEEDVDRLNYILREGFRKKTK